MSRVPDDARPSTAQWLIAARREAGFTNAKDFLAAVREAEGSAPSYSTYAQWESGSVTPRAVSLEPIRRYHTARAPEPVRATETPDPTAALIAAMTGALLAQTRALTDLRVELAEVRETMSSAREAALSERQAQAKILAELGEQLEVLLARGDTPAEAAGQGSGRR